MGEVIRTTIDAKRFKELLLEKGVLEEVNYSLFWQNYTEKYGKTRALLLELKIGLRVFVRHPILFGRQIYQEMKRRNEAYSYERIMNLYGPHLGCYDYIVHEVLRRERWWKNFWKYTALASLAGFFLVFIL